MRRWGDSVPDRVIEEDVGDSAVDVPQFVENAACPFGRDMKT